jgi:hypothetical protein
LDTGRNVVIQNDRLETGKRGSGCLDLLSDIDAVAVLAHHSAQCFDLALDARESSINIVTGFLFQASPPIWYENTPRGYHSSNTPGGY